MAKKIADRIVALLVDHYPTSMSDNEIAEHLSVPTPSVRRARFQAEERGLVNKVPGSYLPMSFTADPSLVQIPNDPA